MCSSLGEECRAMKQNFVGGSRSALFIRYAGLNQDALFPLSVGSSSSVPLIDSKTGLFYCY